MEQNENQQVVQLNEHNALTLLYQYVEKAQWVGSFSLEEANTLKLSFDVCNGAVVENLTFEKSVENLIKAVHQGQKHGGSYTLSDAKNCVHIILFIQQNFNSIKNAKKVNTQVNSQEDLSELADPIPLTSNITEI